MKKTIIKGYVVWTDCGYFSATGDDGTPATCIEIYNAWVFDWLYDAEQVFKKIKENYGEVELLPVRATYTIIDESVVRK